MKFWFRAIALIAVTITIALPNVLIADIFGELEKETSKLRTIYQQQSAAAKNSASRRCLRDSNVSQPLQAEGLSAADRYGSWANKVDEKQKAWNEKLLMKFKQYKGIANQEQLAFCSKLEVYWDDPATSSKKEWIEYSRRLTERRRVDFEQGTIRIEVALDKGRKLGRNHVRNALTALIKKDRAEAFADDQVAVAIEERSRKEIGREYLETAPIKAEPLLSAYLTAKDKVTDQEIDAIVDHMMASVRISNSVVNSRGMTVHSATVALSAPESVMAKEPRPTLGDGRPLPSKLSRKATALWNYVDGSADEAKISRALVLAVIETESAFNPQAKSGVPAYGLMQIVPGSAGLDATQALEGKGRVLAPSYLYDSANNIEIGSTYLHILLYRYLRGVEDPLSRLYCSVAAYNTGAGNVSKAFIGTARIRDAFPVINKLTSQQVYDHLLKELPYEETRRYLERVARRIKKYEAQGA